MEKNNVLNNYSIKSKIEDVTNFFRKCLGGNLLIEERFIDNSLEKRYLNELSKADIIENDTGINIKIWESNRYIAYNVNINHKELTTLKVSNEILIVAKEFCFMTFELW